MRVSHIVRSAIEEIMHLGHHLPLPVRGGGRERRHRDRNGGCLCTKLKKEKRLRNEGGRRYGKFEEPHLQVPKALIFEHLGFCHKCWHLLYVLFQQVWVGMTLSESQCQ